MFSHVTLGTNDLARGITFYDAVMAALGHERFHTGEMAIWGVRRGTQVVLMRPFDGNAASVGNGTHVALVAPTRAAVRVFHQAALAHGGTDEGGPGLRPHYHETYYAAYVRDPDGNKLQAVCQLPVEQSGA